VGKVSFSTFEFGADFLFFFSLYFGFDWFSIKKKVHFTRKWKN
jgi:hypothetical protein